MRWRILRTLLHKEALRHATNRGGLALAGLLVTASLLLAALNPAADQDRTGTLIGGIHHCRIWYDEEDEWVADLESHVPIGLRGTVVFSPIYPHIGLDQHLKYETGTGGIELRAAPAGDGVPHYRIYVRYPDGDRAGMAVYENWFWKESYRFFQERAAGELRAKGVDPTTVLPPPPPDDDLWAQRQVYRDLIERYASMSNGSSGRDAVPVLDLRERAVVGGSLDLRAAIATALVMFSLCFTCVYLMPSLTCEERERGLLLAQALSPATSAEILAAKFLFYPAFGILLDVARDAVGRDTWDRHDGRLPGQDPAGGEPGGPVLHAGRRLGAAHLPAEQHRPATLAGARVPRPAPLARNAHEPDRSGALVESGRERRAGVCVGAAGSRFVPAERVAVAFCGTYGSHGTRVSHASSDTQPADDFSFNSSITIVASVSPLASGVRAAMAATRSSSCHAFMPRSVLIR
jgi:hypothetical protein